MRKLKNSELNRIDISTFKSIKKTPLIIILDDIRSLNNIGSIFRTCDAFKIEKIYLKQLNRFYKIKADKEPLNVIIDPNMWVLKNHTLKKIKSS